jgi:phage/plasmid primase-like uncharacterized protein
VSAHIDLDEVKGALRSYEVLDHYGISYKRGAGDQFESCTCPRRADHDRRRAFVISRRTGRWWCHPCNYGGDLLHLVAELERLEIVRDFHVVLAKAAAIAGVSAMDMPDDERVSRREAAKLRQLEQEAAEAAAKAQHDARAVEIATRYWSSLPTADARGVAYLESRGVVDALRFGVIRFAPAHGGSPSLPLHTRDGRIRNVVCRRLPELGEPKTPGLPRCPTPGTMVNSVRDIESGRDCVLVEGVFDAITATLMWPHDIVLGAHGAGNLAKVAQVAAPRCRDLGARLLIVPHNDTAGYTESRKAARAAIDAGLSLREGSLAIVHTGSKDLNDAWNAGWRAAA